MNIVEMMDNFAVNVEQERIRIGYTQTDFARKLGISLSTYKNIISHRVSNINVEIIPKLYEITGMFVSEFFGCQNRELELLRSYRQLSERQKAYIDALIEYEIALKVSVDETDDYLEVIVPTGNMEDGMILDSAYTERVACPKFMAKYGTEVRCGIRITSNHLHPVSRVTCSESSVDRQETETRSLSSIATPDRLIAVYISQEHRTGSFRQTVTVRHLR